MTDRKTAKRIQTRKYRKTPEGQAYLKTYYEQLRSDPERWNKAKEATRKSERKKRESDRREIIRRFGGKCVRCGFDDIRALQIDHINGGGVKELTSTNRRAYVRKLLTIDPNNGEYQLLCANCNWIKRFENNELIHL